MVIKKRIQVSILTAFLLSETISAMPLVKRNYTTFERAEACELSVGPSSGKVKADLKIQEVLEVLEKSIKENEYIDYSKLNWVDVYKFLRADIPLGQYMQIIRTSGKDTFSAIANCLFSNRRDKQTSPLSSPPPYTLHNNVDAQPNDDSFSSGSSLSSVSSQSAFPYPPLPEKSSMERAPFQNIVQAKIHLFHIFMVRWKEIAKMREEVDGLNPQADDTLNIHETMLREICKIVIHKEKDLDNAWPELVRPANVPTDELNEISNNISRELFELLGPIQCCNTQADLISALQELGGTIHSYCPTDDKSPCLFETLLSRFKSRCHHFIRILIVNTDFEYFTMDNGMNRYRLKPETKLREAFCKKFVEICKRNEESKQQHIVENLNQIAAYVLNFDPFAFIKGSCSESGSNPGMDCTSAAPASLSYQTGDWFKLKPKQQWVVIRETIRRLYTTLPEFIKTDTKELTHALYAERIICTGRMERILSKETRTDQANQFLSVLEDRVPYGSFDCFYRYFKKNLYNESLMNMIHDAIEEEIKTELQHRFRT